MVAQEREDMHLCQRGICYSNFMASQIIRQECQGARADRLTTPQPSAMRFHQPEPSSGGLFPLLFSRSVFYLDLNRDFLHIPLLSFLALSCLHLSHSDQTISSPASSWGRGLRGHSDIFSTNLWGGARYRATELQSYRAREAGTPIFGQLSLYGHSANEGKMYGGD